MDIGAGVYKVIPGEGKVVTYKSLTQKEFNRLVKLWGKNMSITEFTFTTQKILDNYDI